MPGYDDDDWVGEPPEGRYTRDRAKPEFWQGRFFPMAGAGMAILLVILVIVLIAH